MSNTIHLPINRKWFDMILSGEKKEEYREIKPYWWTRLLSKSSSENCEALLKNADLEPYEGYPVAPKYGNDTTLTLTAGYGRDKPRMVIELKWISIKKPNPAWCPPHTEGLWFALKLGKVLETHNLPVSAVR
jgi:hypothetical protein